MCLAIPAKVVEPQGSHAEVDIMGVRANINILLTEGLKAGDKVMVHAGFAISKIEDEYFEFLEDTFQELLGETP
jgi:hydrogenase expression/formation protein HypC